MWAKAAALKDTVDMAVPDGDLVGTGDERPVFLHHSDGVRDFICRIVVVIIHAEDVFAARQFVEHVAFFAQRQFFRVMDVADVKGFRRAIGQAVDDVLMALWGIVEDDEFAAVCRVILIAVHIEQVRQECAAVPGWRDDADKRFFAVGVECFDDGWCWHGVWVS